MQKIDNCVIFHLVAQTTKKRQSSLLTGSCRKYKCRAWKTVKN